MKKFWIALVSCALLTALCLTATADAPVSSGSINSYAIYSAVEHGGETSVTQEMTDGDTTTVWIRTNEASPDLSLYLNTTSVGEIWLRSGHYYSQSYYSHYDRPQNVAVTLWYANGTQSVTYRYRLTDAFLPTTSSESWSYGYQRLLLPQEYSGVTQIDLTIESVYHGTANAGVAISDIAIASGTHATATPRTYTTATPAPYIAYVTPRPSSEPSVVPTTTPEYITPVPSTAPTAVPTEAPAPTEVPSYPSSGTIATLNKTASTRSGPGTEYDEPGSYFSAGDYVNVISKSYSSSDGIWWYQIEFNSADGWMRVYTPASRVNLDTSAVPEETNLNDTRKVITSGAVYFGPSTSYRKYGWSWIYEGDEATICSIEGEWAQIRYYSYAKGVTRRGWVKLSTLSSGN